MTHVTSAACLDLAHETCFGFTAASSEQGTEYVAVPRADITPCDCTCHTGKRCIEIEGQRFDYIVPDSYPAFEDPDSSASRDLAAIVQRAIEAQMTNGTWLPSPDQKPVPLMIQRNLWPFGMPAIVPSVAEVNALPRLPLTVEDYGTQALLTRPTFATANDLLVFSALGMAAEAGETANAVRKIAYQGHELTERERANLIEEAGDVIWFVNSLLDAVGSNLLEAMQLNNRKLLKRYGGSFSTEKSIARVDHTDGQN